MSIRLAGDAFDFRGNRPTGLPAVWSELDFAVWRWVRSHGGDDAVALAAGWTSHADAQGHSGWPVDSTLPDGSPCLTEDQRDALWSSPWVARPSGDGLHERQPLVLDEGYLFLRRNFLQEHAVAHQVGRRRLAAEPPRCPITARDLSVLFNGEPTPAEQAQCEAVVRAVGRKFMVLTGGPGTGKTSTVLRMLLGLSREGQARRGELPLIRVAAPTGKAAQRVSEAMRLGINAMRTASSPLPDDWLAHLSNVAKAESSTVHRLLGSLGRQGGFRHDASDPLPADIVVVDEASMLDLGLLRAMLDALRDDAVLILVGDADQLTSVGTGSILQDLVSAMEGAPDLVRLEHCFRADTLLVPIHAAVRAGDLAGFEGAWNAAVAEGRAQAHEIKESAAFRRRLRAWSSRLQKTLETAQVHESIDPLDQPRLMAVLSTLREHQLLCALREGRYGSVEVDRVLSADLQRSGALADWAGQVWYPGRIVMVTRNDPASGLFNGDVGICLLIADPSGARLQVAFEPSPGADSADRAAVRLFDPNTLPDHEGALALTIHKSQGSEYRHVAVLLPPEGDSPLLARPTLYTGLSRAKTSLELWSSAATTYRCIEKTMPRFGRLASRVHALSQAVG